MSRSDIQYAHDTQHENGARRKKFAGTTYSLCRSRFS